jgi:Uma2 family endonuclease
MVELRFGLQTVELPYTVRIPEVSESQFDELVDEDTRAELLDGVMIVHSPASTRHDDVSGFIRLLQRIYAAQKGLGKVLGPDSLVHLATCRKFAPDWYFLAQKRLKHGLPRKLWKGAPDCAGEVLSPTTRDYDLDEKWPAYRQAKVPEIWLVDLDNELLILDCLKRNQYITTKISKGRIVSSVLPGFWMEASWLWQEPLPNEMKCLQQILG